jgi:hypothetical protein
MVRYWLTLGLFFFLTTAYSQVQEQLSPTQKKYRSVVTEPLTMYKGFVRAGFSGAYGVIDKIFQADGSRSAIGGNIVASSWQYSAFVQYGFTDRLQAEVQIPYTNEILSQTFRFEIPSWDSAFVQQQKTRGRGFSDLNMTMAYQLLAPENRKSFLGVFVTTVFPTGKKNPYDIDPKNSNNYSRPTGSGEFAMNTQLRYRKIAYPFSYNLFASYKMFFGGMKILDAGDKEERSFKSGNYFSVSGSFNMHLNNWIVFKNFVDTYFFSPGEVEGVASGENSWALMYYPGFSFQMKRFRLDQVITFPLAGKLTSADVSYIMMVQYTF